MNVSGRRFPQLFREAAVIAHARRLEGEILLIQPLSIRIVLGVLGAWALATLLFLATATYARVERVSGYLVPRGGVSTIVPPRPGTVADVMVKVGDVVRAGDVILRVASQSALQDGTNLEDGLERGLRRQREELEQKLALLESQGSLEQSRRRDELQRLTERCSELQQLVRVAADRRSIALERKAALAELLAKGIVSEKDHQEQADRVLALDAELRQARYDLLQEQDARRAVEADLALEPGEVAAKQADLRIQVLNLGAALRELEARRGYALVAPIAGRVASLQAVPGGDVAPDVPVALIIPETTDLEAHLLVPTRAAGMIDLDQAVGIRYAAFPAETFGARAARIRRIDSAVLAPSEVQGPVQVEEPVYRVVASLQEQAIPAAGRSYALQPGMNFEADIVLETRSFIAWILEPLYSLKRSTPPASAS